MPQQELSGLIGPFSPAITREPFDGRSPSHLDCLKWRQCGSIYHGDGSFVASHINQITYRNTQRISSAQY